MTDLHIRVFGKPFDNAHDGLADVNALQRLVKHTDLWKKVQTESCNLVSARSRCEYSWDGARMLVTLEPLYKGPNKQIKKPMAEKIANSGLSYQHLLAVYKHGGEDALITLAKDTSGGSHRISRYGSVHDQLWLMLLFCSTAWLG